jgi:hypothetical protein
LTLTVGCVALNMPGSTLLDVVDVVLVAVLLVVVPTKEPEFAPVHEVGAGTLEPAFLAQQKLVLLRSSHWTLAA